MHVQLQLVQDRLSQNLVDQTVRLRQVVLEVGWVGNLPGEEVALGFHLLCEGMLSDERVDIDIGCY